MAFTIGSGFNGTVKKILIDGSNKIYVAGYFTIYNGGIATRIVRLNVDGTIDSGFNFGTGFNDRVEDMVFDGTGKLIVTGYFTTYNGTVVNGIVKLNTNGSIDSSFITGGGLNGFGRSISNSGSLILVGGYFTAYRGNTSHSVVAINQDGSYNNLFGSGFELGSVQKIKQIGSRVYVLGDFSNYKGVTIASNHIIAISTSTGNVDTSFNIGSGANDTCSDINLTNDGNLIVGGIFSTFKGISKNQIVKLSLNGGILSYNGTFIQPIEGMGIPLATPSFAFTPDNKHLIHRYFYEYNGVLSWSLIKVNPDNGDIIYNFEDRISVSIASPQTSVIYTIAFDTEGSLFIGGSFGVVDGVGLNAIAKFDQNFNLATSGVTDTIINFYSMEAIASNQVKLDWEKTSGSATVSNYSIYRKNLPSGIDTLITTVSNSTFTYTHTESISNSKLYYIVANLSPSGTALSNTRILQHNTSTLSVSRSQEKSMDLSWNVITGVTSSILLFRSDDSGSTYNYIRTINALRDTFTDDNLLEDKRYHYRLKYGEYPGSISWYVNSPTGLTYLNTPTDLHARARIGGIKIKLYFDDNSIKRDEYEVYRRVKDSGDPFTLIGTTTNGIYNDNTVTDDNWEYYVKATKS